MGRQCSRLSATSSQVHIKECCNPIAAEFASAADTRASDEFIAENGDGPGVRLEEGSVGVRHALR